MDNRVVGRYPVYFPKEADLVIDMLHYVDGFDIAEGVVLERPRDLLQIPDDIDTRPAMKI